LPNEAVTTQALLETRPSPSNAIKITEVPVEEPTPNAEDWKGSMIVLGGSSLNKRDSVAVSSPKNRNPSGVETIKAMPVAEYAGDERDENIVEPQPLAADVEGIVVEDKARVKMVGFLRQLKFERLKKAVLELDEESEYDEERIGIDDLEIHHENLSVHEREAADQLNQSMEVPIESHYVDESPEDIEEIDTRIDVRYPATPADPPNLVSCR
jgi:hypothetical protein